MYSLEPVLVLVDEAEYPLEIPVLEEFAANRRSVGSVVEVAREHLRCVPVGGGHPECCLDEHSVDVLVALSEVPGCKQLVPARLPEEALGENEQVPPIAVPTLGETLSLIHI